MDSDQMMARGDGGGLAAVRRTELTEDMADVVARRPAADEELGGHLRIGQTFADRPKDLRSRRVRSNGSVALSGLGGPPRAGSSRIGALRPAAIAARTASTSSIASASVNAHPALQATA